LAANVRFAAKAHIISEMNEASFSASAAWLTQAGLAGTSIWFDACPISENDRVKIGQENARRLVNVGFEPANKIGHKRTHAPR